MTALPPAIVLGIDTPIGLAIIRELNGHGVPVHGIGKSSKALGTYSRALHSASTRQPGPLEHWLPSIVAQTGARALFAISEGDLIALARFDPMIGDCHVLTPRTGPLATVLDKSATLAQARLLGIDTPESWQPEAGEDFAARAAALRYPVVAKWANPALVIAALDAQAQPFVKAEFVRDADMLIALLARYDAIGTWPLVQSYCPGNGLAQMLYMEGGRATLRFQHRRVHEWPPEGGVSTLCEAVPLDRHRAQMERSEALLAAIGWEGPAMAEYRHDPVTGRYWLMEINGRFWGGQPLARACGAYFAWHGYRRVVLNDTAEPLPPRDGLRARFMIPETRRLARVLFHRSAIADPFFEPTPLRDLGNYLLGFLDPRMRYYVFTPSDPLPLLADLTMAMSKLLS